MSTYSGVKGFCCLEPKRHIQHITELDGDEASEFGLVLAKSARSIKKTFGAKLVYVYIYGDHIPHLHVHLAPHVDGDIYANDVVKSDAKIDESALSPE